MPFRTILGGLVVVAALALESCDQSPSPTGPGGGTGPGGVTVVRVELNAPGELAPGASVQVTANAVKSNNSIENVTARVQWSSSSTGTLTVSPEGVATGVRRGEALIIARYEGVTASPRVFVLPAGTFRLAGRITESGSGIGRVIVTVLSGVGEGLVSTTLDSGDYALYGVSGRVRVEAKKDGYVRQIHDVDVSAHDTRGFELVPERPILNLSGTYTLSLTTAGCRTGAGTLPDAANRRTYTAAVAQDQRSLTVALTGADFVVANGRGNRFVGHVEADERVIFFIGGFGADYYGTPRCDRCDLVERFGATNSLVIGGSVAASQTGSGITGIFFGTFWLAEGTILPLLNFQSYCEGVHDFDMRRR